MALTDNIVGYWKLDGNSNDAVSTNNGTDTAITYGTTYALINQGANLNGTTSNISLGNVLGATFLSTMTVSGWIKPTGGSYGELLGKTTANISHPIDFYANLGANNYFVAYFGDGTNSFSAATASGTITQNAWNHIVVTYDGGGGPAGIQIYINGALKSVTTAGTATPSNGTDALLLGSRSDAATTFTGDLDEVGIWSRVLTSAEVSQLYNGGAGLQYPFVSTSKGFFNLVEKA